MFNSKQEIILFGTSAWLLLDFKSRSLKIFSLLFHIMTMFDVNDVLIVLQEKIISETEMQVVYSTKVRYSSIDLNQHTNNVK